MAYSHQNSKGKTYYLHGRTRTLKSGKESTLYFGGGTPSLLTALELERVIGTVSSRFELAPGAEITLEANPDDVTPEKLADWRSLGINRLSLCVQSLHDDELHFLRRRHGARQARDAFTQARRAGFENIGLDFIFGLPQQALHSWIATLEEALEMGPDHLSCYQLTYEKSTHLGQLLETGALEKCSESRERGLFLKAHELLSTRGFEHYEVSNYARSPAARSRHNQKYWSHAPYLGLGPSAHSFDGAKRWWNPRDLDSYCAVISSETRPSSEELLSRDDLDLEKLMLGFRTIDGIEASFFTKRDRWQRTVDHLIDEGLIRRRGGRLAPTLEGLLLADGLPLRFY